ncbi:MAG: hypothetical protein P9M03_09965 [Candidatus Theseobacter exili]|nr:hypothetical protein [Candidatus Theseobacter exili]
MLTKKYNIFQKELKAAIVKFKNKKITETEFDTFIKNILSTSDFDVPGKLYCRDGFAFVNELDRNTFQIVSFQINSFGAGVFGENIVKLCTPLLLTIKVHGAHPYLNHNLKDACISIEEFYLGKHFSGSKGILCDRNNFDAYCKTLFLLQPVTSFNHQISYQLTNSNYVCHHIAETAGYAFGALDIYWTHQKGPLFLSSGSCFNDKKDKLNIDIIDTFSLKKMRSFFQVPHYVKLGSNIEKFHEEHDLMLLEITYENDIESFYLPSGYQKVRKKLFNQNVNVLTTQHIVEHILSDYYKRKNAFIVANTYQTLEYLSRALLAKIEGQDEVGVGFLKSASSCKGYYPEHNIDELFDKKKKAYPAYVSEYSYKMFFRPPVLN